MAFALRLDHAALVPPLELARRDAGSLDHFVRCEAKLHNNRFFSLILRPVVTFTACHPEAPVGWARGTCRKTELTSPVAFAISAAGAAIFDPNI